MGRSLFVVVVLVVCCSMAVAVGGYKDEGWRPEGGDEGGSGQRKGEDWFLLQDSKQIVRTDAGNMKVVRGFGSKFMKSPVHIGFITMEPKSLFIPQYFDSSLIIFIRRGGVRIGHIYKDDLVEKTLKTGDIYRIEAGSAFYLINEAEGQRLHVICSIDTSESLGFQSFQSFYIAGGAHPASILSGFDHLTLSTAFNVSEGELREMLTSQKGGAIVYLDNTHSPSASAWSRFMNMDQNQKQAHMRRIVRIRQEDLIKERQQQQSATSWSSSFKEMLNSVFGKTSDKKKGATTGPDSYNIYDRKPDFQNNYGSSIALGESDYSPLKHDDVGVYLVNLTAGSMMAPHINPRATEYGIVLEGAGTIQIVYPNGSLAMNAKVTEGDVFWIPRYFPFCQIASRTGSFEFFGFTTSARYNRPQFLVGSGSLLQSMIGPEFAAAFGISEERLREIVNAQRESTILPSAAVAPPEDKKAKVIRSFGSDMVMGFD
ncbi:hypothetical protein ACJIZ3_012643 [Penstemon smallii]|uniref:Cupin type-1 domain-containing protein n=1 Tax=Penstemon smallii TaxID=265156 RepID=A0ABD3UML9_9LAMI